MSLEDFFPSRDKRLRTVEGLDPMVVEQFERLLAHATDLGFRPYIASATRSCREQVNTGSKVVCSWHLFGRALDIELQGVPQGDLMQAYENLGRWWEEQTPDAAGRGFWGGDWKSYGEHGDYMHFHWAPSEGVPADICTAGSCEADQLAWWAARYDAEPSTPTPRRRSGNGAAGALIGLGLLVGVMVVIAASSKGARA